MSNGNMKTEMRKIPTEWVNLLDKVVEKIEENGYPGKIKHPEIIRLLVHYRPARDYLNKAMNIIIQGFQGIKKVNPEVEKYMKGVNPNAAIQE